MGALCGKEEDSGSTARNELIASAAVAAGPGKPSDRPTLLVVWGGIGAGKSTATAAVLKELEMDASEFVKVGVDDLIEHVPEFVADTESGDAELMKAAYMKHRDVARSAVDLAITKAVAGKFNLMLEWTNEENLQVACTPKQRSALHGHGKLSACSGRRLLPEMTRMSNQTIGLLTWRRPVTMLL